MWNQKPCFRFEIDNFSEKKGAIPSHSFVSGGCEWYLYLQPKGDGLSDERLALFLAVANHKSLQTGWKRSANFYFSVLDQSDKELYRSPIVGQARNLFCAQSPALGFITTLPPSKFQEKGFLKEDRLVIEVFIKIVEAVDGEGGDVSKKDEIVDTIDSKDYASQVTLVRKIFAEHPEIAEEFKPKNQVLNMNILRNACSKFSELAEVGFKLDWLKSKLGEFSLETKKADDELGDSPLENKKADDELGEAPLENKKADDELRSRVQHLEDRIKNHELDRIKNHELMQSDFKKNYLKSKLEEFSLGRKKSYDADGSRVQQLEKRVKNLELMESGFKMDCLKSQLEEISLERKKSYDVDGSRVQQLEERVKNLELMENGLRLDSLKSKLEEVSLEKKEANADGSQVHQLEDRVKNLELMVSDLKVELDKEKARSSADGFLLVEEVA